MSSLPWARAVGLLQGYSLPYFRLSPHRPSRKSRKSHRRNPCPRMASGNYTLARVNRTILLSQKRAAAKHPSCCPKKNTLTELQKRWVEHLGMQTSFGHRTQNALHSTFNRARPIKRLNFINSTGTLGASSIH